jgi:diguanylate cyclase (GGDEF)-like protein/PAS domain S-box-containing protein
MYSEFQANDGREEYFACDVAEQAALYRLIVENTVELIIRYDRRRSRTYVSPSSKEMLGYDPGEMLGRPAFGFNHPDDHERAITTFERIGPECPRDKLIFRVRHKHGHYVWVETCYRYLKDGSVLSVARDITARKHAEDMLAEANAKLEAANRLLNVLVQQDGLTGLANRRCFDDVLDKEFRRACRNQTPLGLVMIDVDHFKSYNDLYGHIAGDECLRRVGSTIRHVLQRPADQAARYGGEEFAVVLPMTDEAGTTRVAEQIRSAVATLGVEHFGSTRGSVTISAGTCAKTPDEGSDTPSGLIHAADVALYRAKAGGRNCVESFVF